MSVNSQKQIFLDNESIKLANTCLENIDEFNRQEAIDTWVKAQAEIFWNYKGRNEQEEFEEKQDYFKARSLLAFYIGDATFEDCRHDNACIFNKFSSKHFDLLQSISLHDYIEHKSFLNWCSRTPSHSLSSQGDKYADFTNACSWIRKSFSKCTRCSFSPGSDTWKNICKHDVILNLDRSIVNMLTSGVRVADTYINYLTNFNRSLICLFDGQKVAWKDICNLLDFCFEHPQNVTMFEVFLIRAILSVHLNCLYEQLVTIKDIISIEDIKEIQAWTIWFQNGCSKQKDNHAVEDWHDAKRYLAFVLTDYLIQQSHSVHYAGLLSNLDVDRIHLLQSLTVHEYTVYKVISDKLSKNDGAFYSHNVSQSEIDIVLKELTTKTFKGKVKSFNALDLVRKLLELTQSSKESISKAKLFALKRITSDYFNHNTILNQHMAEFYDKVFSPTGEMNSNYSNIRLKIPLRQSKYVVSTFEFLFCETVCS
jgi:hypothetical protein